MSVWPPARNLLSIRSTPWWSSRPRCAQRGAVRHWLKRWQYFRMPPWLARRASHQDFTGAYKTIPVAPADARLAHAIWPRAAEEGFCVQMRACPFGATASGYNWGRVALAIVQILAKLFMARVARVFGLVQSLRWRRWGTACTSMICSDATTVGRHLPRNGLQPRALQSSSESWYLSC
jgi:hypothetical protein